MTGLWSKALACGLLVLAACAPTGERIATAQEPVLGPAAVDNARMLAPDDPANVGNWMSYGRGWDENRYSPLTQINQGNVGQLGLAWESVACPAADCGGTEGGHCRL